MCVCVDVDVCMTTSVKKKNQLTQQLTASVNCVATGRLYHYISRNNREYISTDEGPADDDDSYI